MVYGLVRAGLPAELGPAAWSAPAAAHPVVMSPGTKGVEGTGTQLEPN